MSSDRDLTPPRGYIESGFYKRWNMKHSQTSLDSINWNPIEFRNMELLEDDEQKGPVIWEAL